MDRADIFPMTQINNHPLRLKHSYNFIYSQQLSHRFS
jgi:hypothetical protein